MFHFLVYLYTCFSLFLVPFLSPFRILVVLKSTSRRTSASARQNLLSLDKMDQRFSRGYQYLVFLCLVAEVSLICSRCHDFGASSEAGHLTLVNRTLEGYNLSTIQVEHFLECFDACIVDCRCLSFNWEKNPSQGAEHQCQLNFETKDTNASLLFEKPGHSYHDIETTVSYKNSYRTMHEQYLIAYKKNRQSMSAFVYC